MNGYLLIKPVKDLEVKYRKWLVSLGFKKYIQKNKWKNPKANTINSLRGNEAGKKKYCIS